MASTADPHLETGRQALEAGDWATARDAFEAALTEQESAEALLGLGTALWWLEDIERSLRCRERAYAAFRRRPDPFQAALVAFGLYADYGGTLGNATAARGWLERVATLVDDFALEPLEGWVVFGRAVLANTGGDPTAGERLARAAREHARRFGDADLELCALGQIGGAMMLSGRVEEGTALLDEAMAGALGGEGRPDTVVQTSCTTIVTYSRAAELRRAAQWIRAAEEFNRRYGSAHLYAVCRTHLGRIMFALGRWDEAEAELLAAVRAARTAEPALHAEAVAVLAELRVAQGRVAEAAGLVEGFEDHGAATLARAAVQLARGEPGAAAAGLGRRLRELGEAPLEAAPLLELLGEAELARGDTAAALDAARQLAALSGAGTCAMVDARAERAHGRALDATGDEGAAVARSLERALELFAGLEMPFEAARTRVLLARAAGRGEREAAIADARAALVAFEALGAERDADAAAALLRSLGVRAARAGPKGLGVLTKREREVLALLGEGLSNREIAERLYVTRKTAENHVASVLFKLELSGRAQAAAYAVRHLEGEPKPAARPR